MRLPRGDACLAIVAERLTVAQRSDLMSRIRNRDTFPERALRSALRKWGVTFRSNERIRGVHVDVALRDTKTAVLVHGCFWHGCPRHYVPPKSNSAFWAEKFRTNRGRDRRQASVLRAAGWGVVVVWEHSLRADPDRAVRRLITAGPLTRRATQRREGTDP